MTELHYIYDPLCGWCYGAAPLLDAFVERYGDVPVRLHGGGLFSRQPLDTGLAGYIRGHDARIGQLSGQPFGDDYLQGLLNDRTVILDSEPVIAAVLAVDTLDGGAAIPMLKQIQSAHYVSGQKVVDKAVLARLAANVTPGKAAQFPAAYDEALATAADKHIEETRRLMAKCGARGFPAFVLARGDQLRLVDHSACFGKPDRFLAELEELDLSGTLVHDARP